jgi:hypothetical protein
VDQDRTEAIAAAPLPATGTRRRERMRAEAAALAADPGDLDEIRAVREEMASLRTW